MYGPSSELFSLHMQARSHVVSSKTKVTYYVYHDPHWDMKFDKIQREGYVWAYILPRLARYHERVDFRYEIPRSKKKKKV